MNIRYVLHLYRKPLVIWRVGLLPLIVFPLLLGLLSAGAALYLKESQEKKFVLGLVAPKSGNGQTALEQRLRLPSYFEVKPFETAESAIASLDSHRLSVVVVLESSLDSIQAHDVRSKVTLHHHASKSSDALGKVEEILNDYQALVADKRVAAQGLPPFIHRPLDVEKVDRTLMTLDIKESLNQTSEGLDGMLSIFLFFWLLTTSFYVILQTRLLEMPLTRIEAVAGSTLMTFFSCVMVMLGLSIGLSFVAEGPLVELLKGLMAFDLGKVLLFKSLWIIPLSLAVSFLASLFYNWNTSR